MKISVAICTWNRSRLLRQTLETIAENAISDDLDWELVIVDNNSTDDTADVVHAFSNRLPIRYFFEARQGHSYSRNHAVDQATGDLIVWTDNDVMVDSGWLKAYAEGAARHPNASFFGGRITPVFETPKPRWLEETWAKCRPVFAYRDLGDKEFELEPNQFPYGANFAVRTEVQRNFRFDNRVGRKGSGMMGEDEIGMLRRVQQAHHVGVWLPNACVEHFIPDDRATVDYVRRYFIGQGMLNRKNGRAITRSRFNALGVSIHHRICYALKKAWAAPDVWVSHLIRASIAWGEFTASRRDG